MLRNYYVKAVISLPQ